MKAPSGHSGAGIAVIFDMVLTTHFMTLLMVTVWRKHLIFPAMFYTIFAGIELTYVSSAVRKVRSSLLPTHAFYLILKSPATIACPCRGTSNCPTVQAMSHCVQVPEGGWFSLMMAGIYAYIMLLWYYGSSRKNKCAVFFFVWHCRQGATNCQSTASWPAAGWTSHLAHCVSAMYSCYCMTPAAGQHMSYVHLVAPTGSSRPPGASSGTCSVCGTPRRGRSSRSRSPPSPAPAASCSCAYNSFPCLLCRCFSTCKAMHDRHIIQRRDFVRTWPCYPLDCYNLARCPNIARLNRVCHHLAELHQVCM